MIEDILHKLSDKAHAGDDFDLAEMALLFDSIDHPGISTQRYLSHLRKMVDAVKDRHQQLLDAGSNDDCGTKIASLHDVVQLQNSYKESDKVLLVDSFSTLISTIDDRAGDSGYLSLIAIYCGLRLGWTMHGINLPGRFVVRIDQAAERILFDPANEFKLLQAHDIREIVKNELGEKAEISTRYFDVVSRRNVLMHVQNQIKLQKIRVEDYAGALKTVQAMQAFDPEEYRLYLDAGILYARTQQPEPAIFALEHYIAKTPDERSRQEALMLMNDLRGMK